MSKVLHQGGRSSRTGYDIHVDLNPPWEYITFEDSNGDPILCYESTAGWVLYYFIDDRDDLKVQEIGVTAPSHIHNALSQEDFGAWDEFAKWAQSDSLELKQAVGVAQGFLMVAFK